MGNQAYCCCSVEKDGALKNTINLHHESAEIETHMVSPERMVLSKGLAPQLNDNDVIFKNNMTVEGGGHYSG